MKYHAVISIIDDYNNEITRIIKDENSQSELPKSNVNVHDFYIGKLSIVEGRELCQFIEEVKGDAEGD